MSSMIIPVPANRPTFLAMPRCTDLTMLEADVAIIGVPYTVPYDLAASRQPSSTAPAAIREASQRLIAFLHHHDYDFGGPVLAGRDVRIIDCGDVAMQPGQYDANARQTTDVIRTLLDRSVVPIVLGGDHAVPIPVFRAYEGREPIYLVQIDAHIDWRDERNGVRQGLSSPMRRASEMPWVNGMGQLGIRGVGSARTQDFKDAHAYGSIIVGAQELHEVGVAAVLARIPDQERYYVTFDADALDPSIAPAVRSPAYGGVTYFEATNLLRGVAGKGRVVGFDFVEVVPALDLRDATSFLAARLILNMIGAIAHAGHIGSEAR